MHKWLNEGRTDSNGNKRSKVADADLYGGSVYNDVTQGSVKYVRDDGYANWSGSVIKSKITELTAKDKPYEGNATNTCGFDHDPRKPVAPRLIIEEQRLRSVKNEEVKEVDSSYQASPNGFCANYLQSKSKGSFGVGWTDWHCCAKGCCNAAGAGDTNTEDTSDSSDVELQSNSSGDDEPAACDCCVPSDTASDVSNDADDAVEIDEDYDERDDKVDDVDYDGLVLSMCQMQQSTHKPLVDELIRTESCEQYDKLTQLCSTFDKLAVQLLEQATIEEVKLFASSAEALNSIRNSILIDSIGPAMYFSAATSGKARTAFELMADMSLSRTCEHILQQYKHLLTMCDDRIDQEASDTEYESSTGSRAEFD